MGFTFGVPSSFLCFPASATNLKAPNMLPWSVMATAGCLSAAAFLNKALMLLAPSRSEYWVWTWRWENCISGLGGEGHEVTRSRSERSDQFSTSGSFDQPGTDLLSRSPSLQQAHVTAVLTVLRHNGSDGRTSLRAPTRSPGHPEPTIHRNPGRQRSALHQRDPMPCEFLEQHGHLYVELRSALLVEWGSTVCGLV